LRESGWPAGQSGKQKNLGIIRLSAGIAAANLALIPGGIFVARQSRFEVAPSHLLGGVEGRKAGLRLNDLAQGGGFSAPSAKQVFGAHDPAFAHISRFPR
jgi:hypothetical protein